MKTLQEFINEGLSFEEKKDLKACISVSLEQYMFDTDEKDLMRVLVKIVDGQENDTHKDYVQKFKETYKFDYDDPSFMKTFRSLLMSTAKELISDYKLADRYKK